jgi:restriction modification system DNA specificity subunit
MLLTTIGEAFEINPQVRIPKGTEVPFVSMDQVVPGQRNVSAAEKRLFKGGSKFEHGDTLMARITPCLENKKIAQYLPPNHASPSAGSTEFIVIRGKNGVSITPFAYYFVQSPDIHELAISLMTGTSGRQRVDTEAFRMSEIWLPNLTTQEKIVKVLGSLDDKIAANQRTIQSADSLRNALWDKLLKTNTESLPLSSLAEFINGRAFTKNATGTGRVVARIAELNSGIGSNTVFNDIEVHQNHVVLPGELLFAWSGTLMTKRWPYDEAIVNQHIFKVLPISKFDLWALELIIQSQIHYFQMIAAGKATTMGHIKRADLDKTVEVPTSIPDKLNMLGNTLWMLASQAEQENQTLARTRDELLPLLMSGKITVRDAEEASAEVGVDKHEVGE